MYIEIVAVDVMVLPACGHVCVRVCVCVFFFFLVSLCVRQNASYLCRFSFPRVLIADAGFRRHLGLCNTLSLDVMQVSIRSQTR